MPLLVRRVLLAPSIVQKRSSEGSTGSVEPSVASYVETLVGSVPGSTAHLIDDPNGIWLHVDFPAQKLPDRGWKLHVSATPWSALTVLDACVPLLVESATPFKTTSSLESLIELNEGVGGLSQVGKFLTVYPRDADTSVRLAIRLDEATRGLRGPRVLNERPLSPTSLVHYRFGDFVEGNGSESRTEIPPDPFVSAGVVEAPRTTLVADRYLITATLHRSPRGAIHLAVDAPAARTCILKRAWRDAIATPDGKDARDRLREEADVLRALENDAHFPNVMDVFEDAADQFVAMDYVQGPVLAELVRSRFAERRPPREREIAEWAEQLATAVSSMHAAGFVHRDVNPVNVIASDPLVLIDLELAQRIGSIRGSFGAGTPRYASHNQESGGPADPRDDVHGIGALLCFVATGSDPDESDNSRDDIAQRATAAGREISPEIASLIAESLDGSSGIATVDEMLRRIRLLRERGIPS